MDGIIKLLTEVIIEAGIPNDCIFQNKNLLLPFPEEWGFMASLQTIETPARQFRYVSNIKPILFRIVFLFLILPGSALKADQICKGDDCVQVALITGVINIEGGKVQIAINNGVVNITYVGDPKDKEKIKNYDVTKQFISKMTHWSLRLRSGSDIT